jgi:hypothetical protein
MDDFEEIGVGREVDVELPFSKTFREKVTRVFIRGAEKGMEDVLVGPI